MIALSEERIEDDQGFECADGFVFRRKSKQLKQHHQRPNPSTKSDIDIIVRPAVQQDETPIINKNRIMRQTLGSSGRRSSLNLRGKRISSNHNGLCAAPHESVDPTQYYRHIDANQPEPIRMRQLLIWCAEKSILNGNAQESLERDDGGLFCTLQQNIINLLINKEIDVSWYGSSSRVDVHTIDQTTLPPHPLNISNAEKIKELVLSMEKLDKDEKRLLQLMDDLDKRHGKVILECKHLVSISSNPLLSADTAMENTIASGNNVEEGLRKKALADALDTAEITVDSTKLTIFQNKTIEAWNESSVNDTSFEQWTNDIILDVKSNLHRLQTAVYTLNGYEENRTRGFCDDLSAKMLNAYAERERKEMSRVEPMDLLRLLSSTHAA